MISPEDATKSTRIRIAGAPERTGTIISGVSPRNISGVSPRNLTNLGYGYDRAATESSYSVAKYDH